jgi:hypothetical protein
MTNLAKIGVKGTHSGDGSACLCLTDLQLRLKTVLRGLF